MERSTEAPTASSEYRISCPRFEYAQSGHISHHQFCNHVVSINFEGIYTRSYKKEEHN